MTKLNEIKNICILYLLSIIIWLLLVIYREITKRDIDCLRTNIFFKCNGWCIGHFIHYVLLGYFAPNFIGILIILGILFELLEIPLNKASKYIDSKLVQDSIVNTIGLMVGYYIHKYMKK